MQRTDEQSPLYQVVANEEGQYSLWMADREPPSGWRCVSPKLSKADCLAYIEKEWTDMRPLSVRRAMTDD